MTIKEIRKGAPDETATHYSETPMEIIYLKKYKGAWQVYAFGGWFHYEQEPCEEIKPL